MTKDERIRLRVDGELKAKLEDAAEQRGVSTSALCRQILDAGVNQVIQDGEDPRQISIVE